eukprot:1934968-Rhodomonas_salina.2
MMIPASDSGRRRRPRRRLWADGVGSAFRGTASRPTEMQSSEPGQAQGLAVLCLVRDQKAAQASWTASQTLR